MKEDVLFTRTPFGGFKREEVIDYIQKLKQNQVNCKKILTEKDEDNRRLEAENGELTAENADLGAELSSKRIELEKTEK